MVMLKIRVSDIKKWITTNRLNLGIFFCLILGVLIIPKEILENQIGIGLNKIFTIILAVATIQILGVILLKKFKTQSGLLIHGFISGIISSTALTVSLSHKSQKVTDTQNSMESLGFLSATAAMLIQGIILSFITSSNLKFSTLCLFLFPLITTCYLIIYRTIHTKDRHFKKEEMNINWSSILKLTLFICATLMIAHFAKNKLGEHGLRIITFIVSLFEVHGSIIANSQMYVKQEISTKIFNDLILISILSSYISKLAIVFVMGSKYLKLKISIWTFFILLSLTISWLIIK